MRDFRTNAFSDVHIRAFVFTLENAKNSRMKAHGHVVTKADTCM